MKKIIVIGIGLVLSFLAANAQVEKAAVKDLERLARVDSLLIDFLGEDDDLLSLFDVDRNFHFIYAGSSYSSKTYFAGREIGTNQYSLSGQLYYMSSSGFFAGASGSWYSQLDPAYRTTVLSTGFSKGLKKAKFFRYRLSGDYFLYHIDDPDYEPPYVASLNGGISLRSKSLGTRFDASVLVGDATDMQLSWSTYAYINLLRLGKYDRLRFEPEVALFWGSEDAEFLLSQAFVDPTTNTTITTYYQDVFGLLNVQLQLPLSLSLKNFNLEASWNYNLPQSMGDGESYPESGFFRVSLGYIFDL